MPALSVIVVSYNTCELLADCLRSIDGTAGAIPVEVLVVDNASADGSPDMVATVFPAAHLVRNKTNRGFAAANNQALQFAQGELILLLNSDAALRPGCLSQLQAAFAEHRTLGIAGPRLLNSDESTQPSWGDFPTPVTELMYQSFLFKLWPTRFPYGRRVHPFQRRAYERFQWVAWITGAAFMIRRKLLDRIGGLPEDNFMYGEDLEYCWLAREAGYRVAYCPTARAYHRQQGSARRDYSGWVGNYTQAMLAYYGRHCPPADLRRAAYLIWAGSQLRQPIWQLFGLIAPSRRAEIQSRRQGYAQAASLARQILRHQSVAVPPKL